MSGMVGEQRVLPEGWVDASNKPSFRFNEDDKKDYPQIQSGNLVGYVGERERDHVAELASFTRAVREVF